MQRSGAQHIELLEEGGREYAENTGSTTHDRLSAAVFLEHAEPRPVRCASARGLRFTTGRFVCKVVSQLQMRSSLRYLLYSVCNGEAVESDHVIDSL